jgi:hypothetical protein
MDRLSGHRALHLATHAVPILKHLSMTNATMTFKEFGQALGLVHQAWKSGHHEQITTVLNIVRTTFDRLDAPQPEYHRITHLDRQDGHWYRKQWVAERNTP